MKGLARLVWIEMYNTARDCTKGEGQTVRVQRSGFYILSKYFVRFRQKDESREATLTPFLKRWQRISFQGVFCCALLTCIHLIGIF